MENVKHVIHFDYSYATIICLILFVCYYAIVIYSPAYIVVSCVCILLYHYVYTLCIVYVIMYIHNDGYTNIMYIHNVYILYT